MSQILILDTDVASFLMDQKAPIHLYSRHLRGNRLALSFMTVAEMLYGAYHDRWGQRRISKLHDDMDPFLLFYNNMDTCVEWAKIRQERRRRTISEKDAWVAATARARGLPLVTHNARDFRGIGLKIITESGN